MAEPMMKGAEAEVGAYERKFLERMDVSGAEAGELVLGIAELAPGMSSGTHTHAAYEVAYVVAGAAELRVEGEAPRALEAGDSYHLDGRTPHDLRNVGTAPARAFIAWVVEKGKTLGRTPRE